MTTLYSCKSEIDRDGNTSFRITKFDSDMNVESSYLTTADHCGCPAGERPTCRHRQMLPRFLAREAVNTHWLYDFDRNGWVMSDLGEALEQSAVSYSEVEAELSCAEAEGPTEQSERLDLDTDLFAGLAAIPGVQVFTLGDPAALHNAIADAVGEPRDLKPSPPSPRINRRGF